MDHDDIIEEGETELETGEAAIVFSPDGDHRVMVPELDPEAEVPKNVMIAIAVGIKAIKEPAWVKEVCVELFGEEVAAYFEGDDLSQGPKTLGRA